MSKTPLFCKERKYTSKYPNSTCGQQNTVFLLAPAYGPSEGSRQALGAAMLKEPSPCGESGEAGCRAGTHCLWNQFCSGVTFV